MWPVRNSTAMALAFGGGSYKSAARWSTQLEALVSRYRSWSIEDASPRTTGRVGPARQRLGKPRAAWWRRTLFVTKNTTACSGQSRGIANSNPDQGEPDRLS